MINVTSEVLTFSDLGLMSYGEVLALQEELFERNIEAKLKDEPTLNTVLLCEHQPVFTMGKSGKQENLVVPQSLLGAEFFKTNRGGDVTFHGPGQLVVYPILNVDDFGIGLAQYVAKLEEVIVATIAGYGLKGERLEDAAGIWLEPTIHPRKICAIGIKASRNLTMHGLALNVNTDLKWFDKIVPCGLNDKGVTSLKKELGREVDMEEVKDVFQKQFLKAFGA